jgi:zinc protease
MLSQEDSDPNALAFRIGPMIAFGPSHPYGRPINGLAGTVKPLAREDFVGFHDRFWKPVGSVLILVGDVTLDGAVRLATAAFLGWSGAAPELPAVGKAEPLGPGKVYIVDRQDAAQTVVMQLLPGTRRTSDDYYAVRLADAVWGGGFGTRLNLNLREEKGYSYGVFSFPRFFHQSGLWSSFGGVQTDKTKESIAEFVSELKGISGEKPITAKELEDAKAKRMRGYAQQFESLGRIAGQLADLWAAGLPPSELQREVSEIEKATLDQVNGAAVRYAAPSGASLLLVGDRSRIEPAVRELNLGEVVRLDVEGRVTK